MEDMNLHFILSLEHWGQKVTIDIPYSDVDMYEAVQAVRKLLLAAGYSESTINEYIEAD